MLELMQKKVPDPVNSSVWQKREGKLERLPRALGSFRKGWHPKVCLARVKLLNSYCLGRGWEMLIYCPLLASPTPSTVTQRLASEVWQQLPKHSQCKKMWRCSLKPNWRTVSPQKTKPSFLLVKTVANLQLTSKALRLGGSDSHSSENGKVS